MLHAGNKHSKEPSTGLLPESNPALLKRMMTVEEVAVYIGVPKQRIYSLTSTRGIPYHKIGRTVLFDRHEIDAWLDAHKFPVYAKVHPNGGRIL